MGGVSQPLVSCLCVTEDRTCFMSWLLWCFDRQTWRHKELVIIDSSSAPYVSERDDVRVVTMRRGSSVGAKRNRALQEARGDCVFWFDDDDWQHPERIARVMQKLEACAVVGPSSGWFCDPAQGLTRRYNGRSGQVIFNGVGFRRAAVQNIAFPENIRKASDAHWLRRVYTTQPGQISVLDDDTLFFWLCHQHNLSNPVSSKHFDKTLAELRERVGSEAWGDTDTQFERLGSPETERRTNSRGAVRKPATDTGPDTEQNPLPVSVVIKATVLDTAYLEVMVNHMLAQGHYPFAEKIVVVDEPEQFSGKYSVRDRTEKQALHALLDRLVDGRVIDQWITVDYKPARRKAVMQDYFGRAGVEVGTHASTGGPIYATLFGMECAAHDLVLQMDADVFFHSKGGSWVRQAADVMQRDRGIWLMMTHPGPPAGPVGASLKPPNANRAVWDAGPGVWRFASATTRYFLCDRRVLHGRLEPRYISGACEPLERCISRALVKHGACRGALGDLDSWHLHAWSHAEPFPELAGSLAAAVEHGAFPALQAGDYDLRLDREVARRAWLDLLAEQRKPRAEDGLVHNPQQIASKVNASGTVLPVSVLSDSVLSFSVVIPVRDRCGQLLRNTLHSLRWQEAGEPAEVLIVSHGSQASCNSELADLCADTGARLLTVGTPDEPWNKPLALNAGIRATHGSSTHILVMDGDILLAPDFFTAASEVAHGLALCRCLDLPQSAHVPDMPQSLLRALPKLTQTGRMRPATSSGGVQWAPRQFFFDVHGYDEDLVWWGAMDNDMVHRARVAGVPEVWLTGRTSILHQWHLRKHAALKTERDIRAAKVAWQRNHELARMRRHLVVRNVVRWGGQVTPA